MSSKIFNALLEEKIDLFINSFQSTSRSVFFDEETKRLRHSGEFGMYREKISHSFLKFIIPQKFSLGDGFIISNKDEVSTQCDIIIYDRSITPLIQSNEQQTFYPIETVVAVGEIKSIMSKIEFISALNKLSDVKKIKSNIQYPSFYNRRANLPPFDPKNLLYDSLFTFIICEKLNFKLDNITIELDTIYENTDFWNRHNLILSIEDGLFQYSIDQTTGKVSFWAPTFNGETSHEFLKKNENEKYNHFKKFALSLFNGISFATVLYPDMVHYIQGIIPVDKLHQVDKKTSKT
jgi:hypothetical protein